MVLDLLNGNLVPLVDNTIIRKEQQTPMIFTSRRYLINSDDGVDFLLPHLVLEAIGVHGNAGVGAAAAFGAMAKGGTNQ